MQQEAHSPILDYGPPQERRFARRPWMPFVFLTVVFAGEAIVPRSSRWPWPMPEDYVLLGLMLAGALVQSLVSSMPAWAVGVYGLVGLTAFWDGQFHHWNFPDNPIGSWALGWIVAFVCAWAVCRSFPLLRRFRRAA